MELYAVCVLFAIGLGVLIYKGLLFIMFLTYPLPGKELNWKRAPTLPLQELGRKFGAKADKIKRSKHRTHREKQPLAHAEIPMESVTVEDPVIRPSSREYGEDNPGTCV